MLVSCNKVDILDNILYLTVKSVSSALLMIQMARKSIEVMRGKRTYSGPEEVTPG